MSENFQVPARATAVTPSDGTELPAGAIYVGGAGNVSVVTEGGDTVTFSNVPAGFILPLRVTKVRSTSTTATNIVLLW
jgi:hypothetical protein